MQTTVDGKDSGAKMKMTNCVKEGALWNTPHHNKSIIAWLQVIIDLWEGAIMKTANSVKEGALWNTLYNHNKPIITWLQVMFGLLWFFSEMLRHDWLETHIGWNLIPIKLWEQKQIFAQSLLKIPTIFCVLILNSVKFQELCLEFCRCSRQSSTLARALQIL
jgi:hypothetical protein